VKSRHPERHRTERIGWLRAAVLGANDGIVSTASPVLGLSPMARLVPLVAVASLHCLGALGAIAARTGGARAWKGAVRVVFWGALAMAATAAIGRIFGSVTA